VAGDTLILIDSEKMKIPVLAEADGMVVKISVEEGAAVNEGNTVAVLETEVRLNKEPLTMCGRSHSIPR
jgi:biotin carboxyl carrier protein